MSNLLKAALAVIVSCAILTACAHSSPPETPPLSAAASTPAATPSVNTLTSSAEPPPAPPVVPEYEIELVAKVLRGECYDDQPDDKREVVRVICNRVSVGRFGGSIEAVITAPRQFAGYRSGNVPTANDYEIAREVLAEWYGGGCAPLGEYLYFSAGSGHRNVFRKDYREDLTP
jgi:hypothetical protein